MAILDSVIELAKKFSVETEEQTISEMIDAINQKLDDTYPGSRDIEEAVSQFAKNDGPDARLGEKTITENGTYTALTDDLDGYSEVTVDVSGGASYAFNTMILPSDFRPSQGSITAVVLPNSDGFAQCPDLDNLYAIAAQPIKGLIVMNEINTNAYFVPTDTFEGFYRADGISEFNQTGDTVTPGDRYVYKVYIDVIAGTANITKTNTIIPTT